MNKMIGKGANGKIKSIRAQQFFRIMLVLIWTRYTVLPYVLQTISKIPYIGVLSRYAFLIPIVFLTMLAWAWIRKRIRVSDILLYLIVALIIVASMLIYPENAVYIERQLVRVLTTVLLMYFVGLAYSHDLFREDLWKASCISVATVFLYQIYQLRLGRALMQDNMDLAYKTLPSVMYMIFWAFSNQKKRYWIYAVAGIGLIFSFGTRGAILAILVYLCLMYFFVAGKCKPYIKVASISILLVLAYLMVASDLLIIVSEYLSKLFGRLGVSTRIFDYFISGNILEGSGRERISSKLFQAISEKPILGYGLMGDRTIANNYAHNLFVELWCEFGIFVGSAIALFFIITPVKALKIESGREYASFILMLMCMVFSKLMVSGSYIEEPYLFLLIGLSTGVCRRKKSRRRRKIAQ